MVEQKASENVWKCHEDWVPVRLPADAVSKMKLEVRDSNIQRKLLGLETPHCHRTNSSIVTYP